MTVLVISLGASLLNKFAYFCIFCFVVILTAENRNKLFCFLLLCDCLYFFVFRIFERQILMRRIRLETLFMAFIYSLYWKIENANFIKLCLINLIQHSEGPRSKDEMLNGSH